MTQYRATAQGQVPMTLEEEAEFEASRAPASSPPSRIIPPLDFFDLFTLLEQRGIAQAALQSADILLWFQKASAARTIDLDDPLLINGLSDLVTFDLISQDRSDRIKSGLPPA